MARTAPTINGTPTKIVVSLRYIDAKGEKRSDSYSFPTGTLNADIESFVAAVGAITNAALYEVSVAATYAATPSTGDAVNAVWVSVRDNVVIQVRNAEGTSDRLYIPSPEQGLFVAGSNQVEPTDADLQTAISEYIACMPAGFTAVGARFTERRDINKQVKM